MGTLWEAPSEDSFIQQVFMESVVGMVLQPLTDGVSAPGTLRSFVRSKHQILLANIHYMGRAGLDDSSPHLTFTETQEVGTT